MNKTNVITTPWGSWEVLDDGPKYKVKKLTILPKQMTSLQYHTKRKEIMTVVLGVGILTYGTTNGPATKRIRAGADLILISPREIHRLHNDGDEPLVIIEVQLGECDETDIVRSADMYGRA